MSRRLEAHAHRKIRAFWRAPDPGNHGSTEVFDEFMDLIYTGSEDVSPATAEAVNSELRNSELTVRDVLNGWRPEALR